TVERRQRDEVEDAENDVQADDEEQEEKDVLLPRPEADDRLDVRSEARFDESRPDGDSGEGGEEEVRGRPGKGDDGVAPAGAALEAPGVHGGGLGPPEAEEQEQHGADGVQVRERVEREP